MIWKMHGYTGKTGMVLVLRKAVNNTGMEMLIHATTKAILMKEKIIMTNLSLI
jgi:hypothetical protein